MTATITLEIPDYIHFSLLLPSNGAGSAFLEAEHRGDVPRQSLGTRDAKKILIAYGDEERAKNTEALRAEGLKR